jgi:hypothetical protein
MPAFVERDAVGLRRDLSDALAIADRKKTAYTSALPKGVAPTNTLTEWPVDNYPAPSIAGAIDEQPVQDYENINNVAAILSGRVQIKQRSFRLSRHADRTMDQAGVGRKKAFAKAAAKCLTMVKRDWETIALGDGESVAGTGTVGAKTRGMIKWALATAQSDLPVDSNFRPPSAQNDTTAIASWNDETITTVLQSLADQTGDFEMDLVFTVGSTLRRKLSRLTFYDKDDAGYTQVRRFNQDAESAKITMKVSVLDTDFGRVVIKPSSFINLSGDPTSAASKRAGLLHPMVDECVRMRFGWDVSVRELPDDGGGRRALCESAAVIEVGNPLWLARFLPSA